MQNFKKNVIYKNEFLALCYIFCVENARYDICKATALKEKKKETFTDEQNSEEKEKSEKRKN